MKSPTTTTPLAGTSREARIAYHRGQLASLDALAEPHRRALDETEPPEAKLFDAIAPAACGAGVDHQATEALEALGKLAAAEHGRPIELGGALEILGGTAGIFAIICGAEDVIACYRLRRDGRLEETQAPEVEALTLLWARR